MAPEPPPPEKSGDQAPLASAPMVIGRHLKDAATKLGKRETIVNAVRPKADATVVVSSSLE